VRALRKPTELVEDVFSLCISRVADATLKARLQAAAPDIKTATARFNELAASGEVYELTPTSGVGAVTTDEMVAVYVGRMAKKGQPGRPVYDRLMSLPTHGQCPLCAQRVVSTLDHHLPKKKFPALVVTPTNLVAACADCNKAKLEHHATTAAEQTLHPYFDNIEVQERWLHAVVEEMDPPSLRFLVKPLQIWSPELAARAKNHFEVFGLDKLYSAHAAQDLVQMRHQLKNIFGRGGGPEVRDHLNEIAASRLAARVNSWQSAMYEALRTNAWFCDGGFEKIPFDEGRPLLAAPVATASDAPIRPAGNPTDTEPAVSAAGGSVADPPKAANPLKAANPPKAAAAEPSE
jgi:hypothetical protein